MHKANNKILVTSALPYANGPIHIGHLVEYIQTDVWVRFLRLTGRDCTYVCASDAHGTPIMLRARKDGIAPEVLVERYRHEHQKDFADFLINFDNYHSTHSEENRILVEDIYSRLLANGHIGKQTIQQAYDEQAQMFLPDRFLRGTCPICKAEDQYGDSCEICGATYAATDLIDARSIISGTAPVQRATEHQFFCLANFESMLREWTASGAVDEAVARKLGDWFEAGLKDWDITRDAPYFGFRIPGTEDKYFYVWLDAPIGYLASFRNLCDRRPDLNYADFFGPDCSTELYHFIGKDIVYFHTLFWPAVLQGAGLRKPTGVFAHGFLTVNGQKMSKSRGTFIAARTYLDHLQPEYLRYYYASKLGPGIDDIDLNIDDFVARTNSELVGKLVNIASRCAGFINKSFANQVSTTLENPKLQAEFVAAGEPIGQLYYERRFSRATREIMLLADRANQYIDERKPWVLARDPATLSQAHAVCTQGLNLYRILMIYLKPVLPALAAASEAFLNTAAWSWQDRATPLLGTTINTYEPLITRIDPAAISRILEASREAAAPEPQVPGPEKPAMISIDEFLKIDLRVARILTAEPVEGADKLLRITVDAGGEQRTVMAGIRPGYDAAQLIGKHVVLVANLQPRKMRFGTSEGMLLAAGDDNSGIFLISPDDGASPGMKVR